MPNPSRQAISEALSFPWGSSGTMASASARSRVQPAVLPDSPTRARASGIELDPLLKKAGLTAYQVENPDVRVKVQDQIAFLNLTADAL